MKQVGYRAETYTKRHWRCEGCGREGMVLIHRDDDSEKAAWRREQSHKAQSRSSRCFTAGYLRWWTVSQELKVDPNYPV